MSIASKLQIKPGQSASVIGKPDAVVLDLGAGIASADDPLAADALVVFCNDRAELEQRKDPLLAAASRDALTWVAYPKAGQLGTDLNRDSVASLVSADGVRPVRQVSIDEVWSALRLRPA